MKYDIEWTRRALRVVRRLDKTIWSRVADAIQLFAETGHGDIKKLLTCGVVQYRLRVCTWRVRFRLDQDIEILFVQRVLPRGEAYKDI